MTKPGLTRAEQLRRHREIFLYAREHNLTLREAEKALARAEWEAAQAQLAVTRRCGRSIDDRPTIERAAARNPLRPAPDHAPWMMRD